MVGVLPLVVMAAQLMRFGREWPWLVKTVNVALEAAIELLPFFSIAEKKTFLLAGMMM